MIISTILRLVRGAARASFTIAKVTAKKSKDLMYKDKDKNSKDDDKSGDKAKREGRSQKINDASAKIIRVSGRGISEGLILAVGVLEDLGFVILVTLLILGLIIVMLLPVVGTMITAVMNNDITVRAEHIDDGLNGIGTKKNGSGAGDPTTYDWWGNKDANLLLLTENKDKELYQLIACNAELQKYGVADTTSKRLWNMYNGIGLLMSEMNGGMYTENMGLHNGGKEEIDKIINDKCNYVFAYHSAGSGDGLGDGPIGLTWNYAEDKSYDFGPFSVKNVNQTYLKDSITQSGRNYTDNQGYAQWTLPGGLKWCYNNSFEYSLDSTVNSENKETVSAIFDRWGIEKTEENLLSLCVTDYYAKHHGYGDVDRAYIIEYIVALYLYADNNLNNVSYVDKNGNYSIAFVNSGHGHMMEFLENYVGMSLTNSNIQVVHDGKKIVYDYENGDTLAKALLSWAKTKNEDGYKHLKTAIDWGGMYAPEYKSGGNPKAYNFSSYSSNLVACLGVYFSGQTVVNYIVDKLGLVFGEDEDGVGGVSFSKAATKTQANLKDTMLMHYVKGGVTAYDTPAAFLADVENYKKANPDVKNVCVYTKSTNPWLNDEWCAATVKGLMKETKLSTSDKTLFEALTENGSYPDTSYFANLGIGGVARESVGEQSASTSEGDSPYIKVHFTNKDAIRNASTGDIGGYPMDASSPQVASYKSPGKVIVSKESLYIPKTGDVIIYSYGGFGWSHVGFCYDYDSSNNIITTIEGNTVDYSVGRYSSHSFNYIDNQSLAWVVEIDYVGLEEKYGLSSTKSSNPDNTGVFKVGDAVKSVGTGLTSIGNSKQLIDVVVDGTTCKVTTYEGSNNDWDVANVLKAVSGHVGSGGVASKGDNANESKSETPYGTYYCGANFGGFGIAQSGLKIDWKDVSSTQSYWGTSNNGKHRNRFYTANEAETSSDEDLTRICNNGLYKYGLLIEYNYDKPTTGGGSAFFVHVGNSATAGCVAISESDMQKLVKWLDKSKKPVIMIHDSSTQIKRQAKVK